MLLRFGAVASMVHGIVKFNPSIMVDETPTRHRCYQIMEVPDITKGTKRKQYIHPKEKETSNNDYPNHLIRIGTDFQAIIRQKLVALLKRYTQFFAWKPTDMVGVDSYIIEHGFNIKQGASSIKQKK